MCGCKETSENLVVRGAVWLSVPAALLVISWLVSRRKHGSRNCGEAGFDSSVYVTLKAQLLESILMDENRSSTLGQYLQFGDGKKRIHEKYERETGDT